MKSIVVTLGKHLKRVELEKRFALEIPFLLLSILCNIIGVLTLAFYVPTFDLEWYYRHKERLYQKHNPKPATMQDVNDVVQKLKRGYYE